MEGVAVIVHCAGNGRGDATMTQTPVRAGAAQREIPHLVFISVVGADRVPVSGIDRSARTGEEAVTAPNE